jgi:hypothetical protein
LCNDQTGFDGLSQPDFVSQNASALGNPLECEDHGIDLMRIRIDAALPLCGSVALLFIRPTQPDELFGQIPTLDGVGNGHRYASD